MILGALVQNLIFQDGAASHLGFWPLAKNARIFGRDMGANFFYKTSIENKSIVKPY